MADHQGSIDDLREFDEALAAVATSVVTLRLYVAGNSPRALEAVANLRALCERRLAGRYSLEVIDIYTNPQAAGEGAIIAAPTLVKTEPLPVRRVIGSMADERRVLVGLDIWLASGAGPGADAS